MSLVLHAVRVPLAEFDLEVSAEIRGRVTGLFGPSGAGKTTLLEIIAGLRRPVAGSVQLHGSVLSDVAAGVFVRPEHRSIGYVPQDGALFPHLSVLENLTYGCRDGSRQARPRNLGFDHVLDVLQIGTLLERSIRSLSGGEKQRVALGRALLANPRFLLLDEPMAGLDAALKDRLLPFLQRLRDEFDIPMLYVTHSAEEVVNLCDDVLVLSSGRVIAQGPPQAIFIATPGLRYARRQ